MATESKRLMSIIAVSKLAGVSKSTVSRVMNRQSRVSPAAVKAVEHVDICVGRLLAAIEKVGGAAIVLADHGNCEQMIDPATGGPHTAHTTYDVELFVVDSRFRGKKLREGGRLADVAPTALHVMGLPRPAEMTGVSLIPE